MNLWPSFPIYQPSTHSDSFHHSSFPDALQCTINPPPKTKTGLLLAVNCYPSHFYREVSPWLASVMRCCKCVHPCFWETAFWLPGWWLCISVWLKRFCFIGSGLWERRSVPAVNPVCIMCTCEFNACCVLVRKRELQCSGNCQHRRSSLPMCSNYREVKVTNK